MQILVACFKFPEHDTNSGDQRLLWIIRALLDRGDHLVVLARDAGPSRYRTELEAMGVECICDAQIDLRASQLMLRAFFAEKLFDAAIFSSFGIYNTYACQLRVYLPECHLALDTVDLNYLRLEREAAFYPNLIEEAKSVRKEEMTAIQDADSIWVVSDAEKALVASLLAPQNRPIHTVPSVHKIIEPTPEYAERAGVLFIGGYNHRPNVDAVHYFMTDIYPRLAQWQEEPQITIAGSNPPASFDQYKKSNVAITGYVKDHRSLLLTHRVGIAPLRFGAGLKGKVLDYLACGLPCVSTTIGAEGMAITSGREMIVSDHPDQFAGKLHDLYQSPVMWQALSVNGKQFVNDHYSPSIVSDLVMQARESMAMKPEKRGAARSLKIEHFCANPGKVAALASSAIKAFKKGGIDELYDKIRVSTRKPPL